MTFCEEVRPWSVIAIFAMTIGHSMAATPQLHPDCHLACTFDFRPVCSTLRNGSEITFSNACISRVTACQESLDLASTTEGECQLKVEKQKCPLFCSSDFRPVCSTLRNGTQMVFSNACASRAAACNQNLDIVSTTEGDCQEKDVCHLEVEEQPKCPLFCSREFQPVCSTLRNGTQMTFSNACVSQASACHQNLDIAFTTKGQCHVKRKEPKCPLVCTADFRPVCSTLRNGSEITFTNACASQAAVCLKQWDIISTRDGDCNLKPKDRLCPSICTDDFRPVCSTLRYGAQITFTNDCASRVAACEQKLEIISTTEGECECQPTCPIFCTADFKPVCSTLRNGTQITFSNACRSSVAACLEELDIVSTRPGECHLKRAKTSCPSICTMDYLPVCSTLRNGTQFTYSNACASSVAACQQKLDIVSTKKGECPLKRVCPQFCTKEFSPVCSRLRNGTQLTFSNACRSSAVACIENLDIVSTIRGECPLKK